MGEDTGGFQYIQCSQWISDSGAVELWGITDGELKEIRRSLEEFGG